MSLFPTDYTLASPHPSPSLQSHSPTLNRSSPTPHFHAHIFPPSLTDSPDPKSKSNSPYFLDTPFEFDNSMAAFEATSPMLGGPEEVITPSVVILSSPLTGSEAGTFPGLAGKKAPPPRLDMSPIRKKFHVDVVSPGRVMSADLSFLDNNSPNDSPNDESKVPEWRIPNPFLNVNPFSARAIKTAPSVKPLPSPFTVLTPSPTTETTPIPAIQIYRPPAIRAAPPPPIMIKAPAANAQPVGIQQRRQSTLPKSLSVQRRRSSWGYVTYEDALRGARQHEQDGMMMKQGSEKAREHLSRASELYGTALGFKPWELQPLVSKCRVVLLLASHYDTPFMAITDLRNAVSDLEMANREHQDHNDELLPLRAKLSDLLCNFLKEIEQYSPIIPNADKRWSSDMAESGRKAMELWEEISAEAVMKADNSVEGDSKKAAMQATEALMSLATTAANLMTFAPTSALINTYFSLAEMALDQASDMVMVAKPAIGITEPAVQNPFLTQISLLSCDIAIKKVKAIFGLGHTLDEEEIRNSIGDLEILAERERSRMKSMRGVKAEVAATSAFFAMKQLGDAQVTYAHLLRRIWKQRSTQSDKRLSELMESINRVTGKASPPGVRPKLPRTRSGSTYSGGGHSTIQEESEDSSGSEGKSVRTDSTSSPGWEESVFTPTDTPMSFSFTIGSSFPANSCFERAAMLSASALSLTSATPGSGGLSHRGNWIPSAAARDRRLSSIGLNRGDPTVSAWERRPSVLSPTAASGGRQLPSIALYNTAVEALLSANKHYKMALNILASSSLNGDQLAQTKSELLNSIAEVSLFLASLSDRCPIVADKRNANFDTCGIYGRWAAREVGMASLIDGTAESRIADRKAHSWRAKEAGKRAIMTVLRMWWYSAATKSNGDAKMAARDAVRAVLKRVGPGNELDSRTVAKMRWRLLEEDGEVEASENLFWSEVDRILSGGDLL